MLRAVLVIVGLLVILNDAFSLNCRCSPTTTADVFTIIYDYRLNQNYSVWAGAIVVGAPCAEHIDSHQLDTSHYNQPLTTSTPNVAASTSTNYACGLWKGLVGDCTELIMQSTPFVCSPPAPPQAPTPPSADDVTGPVSGTPLGIGLAVGMVVLVILIVVIGVIVYKKRKQNENV
eukprot:TRINITY_DN6901_c0_g1_i1.p1 TRINITY_DN6901_c0_g1~~TRINITY_DN6901_c0_g1_i1.p1  ORF type:complete len:175 (-),score=18.59 TRINITY_DN6901_c0_g1_i1:23-547(-)